MIYSGNPKYIGIADIENIVINIQSDTVIEKELIKTSDYKIDYKYPYLRYVSNNCSCKVKNNRLYNTTELESLALTIKDRISTTFININGYSQNVGVFKLEPHQRIDSLRIHSNDFDFNTNNTDSELLEIILPLIWRYILSGTFTDIFSTNKRE